MGRPSWKRITDEPLEARFAVSLSDVTLRAIKAEAGRLGVSAAELARSWIIAAAREQLGERAGER